MSLSTTKYAQEVEFYGLDWSQRGTSVSIPITTSTWTVPSPLTGVSDTFTATTTQIKIGGGVPGESYSLTNVVTTASGQTLEAVLAIRINIV